MIQQPYSITSMISRIPYPWKLLISILLGIVMSFSFAPFGAWPTILLSINLFFILLFACPSALKAGFLGFSFGFGYYSFGVSWLSAHFYNPTELVGWVILGSSALGIPIYTALFTAFFSYIAWVLGKNLNSLNRILLFSACFALSEWCLGNFLTRFPWQLLGYTSYEHLPLMQFTSLGGIYGLSLLITLTALSLSCLLIKETTVSLSKKGLFPFCIWGLFLTVVLCGFYRLKSSTDLGLTDTRLRLVVTPLSNATTPHEKREQSLLRTLKLEL